MLGCSPSAARLSVLLGTLGCLLRPISAAMMSPKAHAEAVRSLARCDATVSDQNGQNFFWRVERSAMPSLPTDPCHTLIYVCRTFAASSGVVVVYAAAVA